MKLSVLIPAYNEEKTIESVVEKVRSVRIKNVKKEIIIINDGSSDGTEEISIRLSRKYPEVKLISYKKNAGKGWAIRRGLSAMTGDVMIVQDADLEYNPAEFPMLLAPIISGETEVVYGSRFAHNKSRDKGPNYFGNRAITKITNILYGSKLTDMETGYKMLTKNIVDRFKGRLTARKFDFEPDITSLLLKAGCRIKEVPISYMPRTKKEGKKINWKDGIEAFWTLVKYRLK